MRALTFTADGVRLADVPEPSGTGTTVRVERVGICGTDVSVLAAGAAAVVPGHEIVGTTGDGTRVVVQPNLPCGVCPDCGSGQSQRCPQSMARFLGMTLDGGFAELVRVDSGRLHPVPDGMDVDHAALAEPAAVARHAVARVGAASGAPVLVIGGGSIGLLAAAQMVAAGHPVELVAHHPHQGAAAEAVGAVPRSPAELGESTYTWILDTAGSQSAADLAYVVGRPGARLVSIGALDWATASSGVSLAKEIELVPSVIYSRDEFAQSLTWLHAHPGVAARMVTHRFTFDDAARAFAVAGAKAENGSVKVLLTP